MAKKTLHWKPARSTIQEIESMEPESQTSIYLMDAATLCSGYLIVDSPFFPTILTQDSVYYFLATDICSSYIYLFNFLNTLSGGGLGYHDR